MQIVFEKVEVQNFLSFGDNVTIFDYKTGLHAVTGLVLPGNKRNGAGKSTILTDSITFAVYDRTMRDVKRASIINEKNGSKCLVAIQFSIGPMRYRIERGIKPNFVKIWENKEGDFSGEPLEFSSVKIANRWILEKIQISYETFINLIVLNINHSTPFLEMDPTKKRPVLVDLVSLGVYGKMAEIAKKKHLEANGEKKLIDADLKTCINNLSLSKDKRAALLKEVDNFDVEKQESIDLLVKSIETKKEHHDELEGKITSINYKQKITDLSDKKDTIDGKIRKLTSKIQDARRDKKDAQGVLDLLDGTPTCPTCKSKTDNPDIKKYVGESKAKIIEAESDLSKYTELKNKGEDTLSKLNKKISDIRVEKSAEDKYCVELESVKKSIKESEERLESESARILDIENVISEDEIIEKEAKVAKVELDAAGVYEEVIYNKFLRSMLGDAGIGKYVIRKVLPFLNKKVNEYLSVLGSDYTLVFDADLKETLRSKSKGDREYGSFSGGEKKRIDLSVLLAMMDVAKTQNSIDTNILIFDELLDTSMDADGVESFMWHLKETFKQVHPDKCIYVITHRKEIGEEVFDTVINVVKQDDFTTINY